MAKKSQHLKALSRGYVFPKVFESEAVATAMNGIFVPRDLRPNTVLEDGDQIEILAPLQGG